MEIGKNWELADPAMGQKVAELWKMYDENDMDASKRYFADTVTMWIPTAMTGPRDSILAWVKQGRSMQTKVSSSVRSAVSLRDKDNGETWAVIWEQEVDTDATGKVDSFYLHEAWQFDKDMKVNFMIQYVNKPAR